MSNARLMSIKVCVPPFSGLVYKVLYEHIESCCLPYSVSLPLLLCIFLIVCKCLAELAMSICVSFRTLFFCMFPQGHLGGRHSSHPSGEYATLLPLQQPQRTNRRHLCNKRKGLIIIDYVGLQQSLATNLALYQLMKPSSLYLIL